MSRKRGQLRIVSGQLRGRVLQTPPGDTTRPTRELVRKGLFDRLGGRVGDSAVLDLFAGSGALGIEALSRGARETVFAESNRLCVALLRRNVQALGLESRSTVLAIDVWAAHHHLPRNACFDLVFADPPWKTWGNPLERARLLDLLRQLERARFLAPEALCCIESPADAVLSQEELPWTATLQARVWGRTRMSFIQRVC
ncbi:MAG: 16S rRNA (guanine(966)-N(2))-methyltransferase RsmD [Planctomycetota bacterium]